MSREEKLREIVEQEQALMREIYGFDAGVKWAEARIIKLLDDYLDWAIQITQGKPQETWEHSQQLISGLQKRISFIKGEAK